MTTPYVYLPQFTKILTHPELSDVTALLQRSKLAIDELVSTVGLPEGEPAAVAQPLLAESPIVEEIGNHPKRPSVENFIIPLEDIMGEVEQQWTIFYEMTNLLATPQLLKLRNQLAPLIAEFFTELGQHAKIAKIYMYLSKNAAQFQYSPTIRKALADAEINFLLAGAYLAPKKQLVFKQTDKNLAERMAQFASNLLADSAAGELFVATEAELVGLTAEEKKQARAEHQQKLQKSPPPPPATQTTQDHLAHAPVAPSSNGFSFPLTDATYLNFMKHVEVRQTRERYYKRYLTRATRGEKNNTPLINEILQLRRDHAQLLSFQTYDEEVLQKRLLKTSEEVFYFLEQLFKYVQPQALKEKALLTTLAKEHDTSLTELQPWDVPFYVKYYKKRHFNLDENELKAYFPLKSVLKGLLEIVRSLFGCVFVCEKGVFAAKNTPERDIPRWHEDVLFYTVYDEKTGDALGHLYMDLYARKNKQGGAWMDGVVYNKTSPHKLGVVFLVCNFACPASAKDALLTQRDIETLFHEMGHCLHHLLTKVQLHSVAGLNGVPLEGIEFPSQFLERWASTQQTLKMLSAHVDTGAPLPNDLIARVLQSKHALNALLILTQLEYSLIDMSLHKYYPNRYMQLRGEQSDVDTYIRHLRESMRVWTYPLETKFQNQFLHIFSHGYAAGYYTYLYSNMYAADAFQLFQGKNLFSPQLGNKVKQIFLEQGGSRPFNDLYKEFRSRAPVMTALLDDLKIPYAKVKDLSKIA